jgi:hypothetical protein
MPVIAPRGPNGFGPISASLAPNSALNHTVTGRPDKQWSRIYLNTGATMYRLSTACLIAIFLFGTPAFAFSIGPLAAPAADSGVVKVLCNPGTPKCAPTNPTRQKIVKGAQGVLQDPAHNEGQCQGNGLCGNNSGGAPSPNPTVKQSGGQTTSTSQTGTSQQKAGGGGGSHH